MQARWTRSGHFYWLGRQLSQVVPLSVHCNFNKMYKLIISHLKLVQVDWIYYGIWQLSIGSKILNVIVLLGSQYVSRLQAEIVNHNYNMQSGI